MYPQITQKCKWQHLLELHELSLKQNFVLQHHRITCRKRILGGIGRPSELKSQDKVNTTDETPRGSMHTWQTRLLLACVHQTHPCWIARRQTWDMWWKPTKQWDRTQLPFMDRKIPSVPSVSSSNPAHTKTPTSGSQMSSSGDLLYNVQQGVRRSERPHSEKVTWSLRWGFSYHSTTKINKNMEARYCYVQCVGTFSIPSFSDGSRNTRAWPSFSYLNGVEY